MNEEPVIGIDLGTTNSEVAVFVGGRVETVEEDGSAILPSCVGLDPATCWWGSRHATSSFSTRSGRYGP